MEAFIRINWEEEAILFYLEFEDETAIRQIEIRDDGVFRTSLEAPINGNSMLYDQDFSDLEKQYYSIISKEEFNKTWGKYDAMD